MDRTGINNGTVIGGNGTKLGNFPYGRQMNFDGVNDYISISGAGAINSPTKLTIAAWIYPTSLGTGSTLKMIVGGHNTTFPYPGYSLTLGAVSGVCTDSTKIGFWSGTAWICSNANTISANTWIFVTVVHNGTHVELYKDGIGQGAQAGYAISSYNGAKSIGSTSYATGHFFNGSIDEVMIFNRSLSAGEIRELYSKGRAKWTYGEYVNISSDATNMQFNISLGTTNLLPSYKLLSGSSNFYSPLISGNNSFTIFDTVSPSINFTSPSDGNGTSITRPYILVNVTASDSHLANITVRLYNSTALLNTSVSTTSPFYLNFTGLALVGTYYFNASAIDTEGNINNTETWTILTDNIPPEITLNAPVNASNLTGQNTIFNFTGTDNIATTLSCILYIDGTSKNTNSSVINGTLTNINASGLSDGVHLWNVNCTDGGGNQNTSLFRTFTLDNTAPNVTNIRFTGNTTDDLDPLANLIFNATVADDLFSIDKVFLQFYNSTNWINYSMSNITNTIYSANITLPNLERNYTYNIFRNDSFGNANTTANYTIEATWDCSWSVRPTAFEELSGYFQSKQLGNISINRIFPK
ncbi:hypothetical protein J4408_04330 [Candidatus Pacearchaeota archaeon]|nr:hypothetical protein [Candidatus Pacearchaeota archaeon]